jgi:hypothetical protein
MWVNPLIHTNLPYNTLKDLTGVIPFASLPSVLCVCRLLRVSIQSLNWSPLLKPNLAYLTMLQVELAAHRM